MADSRIELVVDSQLAKHARDWRWRAFKLLNFPAEFGRAIR
jgi:hypothetical protein